MIKRCFISIFRCDIVSYAIILSLFSTLLFSCQEYEDVKYDNPDAFTKFQAKDYFEQTASTLKFITASSTPVGTK